MSASKGAAIVRGDALSIPLADESVDLIVTSPPYFALRSYSDGGEHYEGQIGSEATPTQFLEALWAVTAECWRVLKPSGSLFVNLGDKYAGSGGHNNSSLAPPRTGAFGTRKHNKRALRTVAGEAGGEALRATRRQAPDRYNQASDGIRTKSLMGLPPRYAAGCVQGLADPCVKDHEHVGRHPAYLPSEQCRGLGWIQRAEIIWDKPNGLPESAKDRVHRHHEQWYHLTKQGRYFANIDEVRTPHADHTLYCAEWEAGQGGYTRARSNPDRQDGGNSTSANPPHPLGKIPNAVWKVATKPLVVPDWLDVDHFAAFPDDWPRSFISGWCPPDGIVLDPFGGTGTTAMVARALGRFGVSLDLSADYLRLANWRIFQSGQAAKVAAKSDRDRQGVLL